MHSAQEPSRHSVNATVEIKGRSESPCAGVHWDQAVQAGHLGRHLALVGTGKGPTCWCPQPRAWQPLTPQGA